MCIYTVHFIILSTLIFYVYEIMNWVSLDTVCSTSNGKNQKQPQNRTRTKNTACKSCFGLLERYCLTLGETAKIKGGRVQDQNSSANLRMTRSQCFRASTVDRRNTDNECVGQEILFHASVIICNQISNLDLTMGMKWHFGQFP